MVLLKAALGDGQRATRMTCRLAEDVLGVISKVFEGRRAGWIAGRCNWLTVQAVVVATILELLTNAPAPESAGRSDSP